MLGWSVAVDAYVGGPGSPRVVELLGPPDDSIDRPKLASSDCAADACAYLAAW
jgi:hypothetical protein